MRLIDADALIKTLGIDDLPIRLTYEIENAPTVDAVPVIRCKDCRWGREVCGNIECCCDMNVPPEYHGFDWFCPNGEREKKNEGSNSTC